MKSNLLRILLLSLVLAPATLLAQDEKTLWINGDIGLNSNWMVNQNAYQNSEMNYATSFGLSGGLGICYFLSDGFGVNISPGYVKLGQNYHDELESGTANRKVKLSYITLPMLIMKEIPMTDNPTWVSFGPELMLLTSANQEFKSTDEYPVYNAAGYKKGDIKERFKPFDLALHLSIIKMYELRSSSDMMFFYAFNTAFGLLDINSKDWQIPDIHDEYKGSHNFYFGIRTGIMFNASGGKY